MKVSVYGTGYVGLVTGICLAEIGHTVCCLDVDVKKIAQLKDNVLPIYEEGLQPLLEKHALAKNVFFTTNYNEAVDFGEIQIIAVGTPSAEDGSADLQYVEAVASKIGSLVKNNSCVVNKSTVPVGTAERVEKIIKAQLLSRDVNITVDVASNPEFLREGQAVKDCLNPDRIIIGVNSISAEETLRQLYKPFLDKKVNFLSMSRESSELTKYAANAFLATKISFMNEMSQLAEKLGANIHEIKAGISMDTRINGSFLNAGCGFGGSCFPKDVSAIKHMSECINTSSSIVSAVLDVNDQQHGWAFKKLHEYFSGDLKGKTIAIWGLAFKPNTDDIRYAPSISLMKALWAAGANVKVYDPMASNNILQMFQEKNGKALQVCGSKDDALKDSDALVLVTEWPVFSSPDFNQIKQALNYPLLIDGRNFFQRRLVEASGLSYIGVGC